MFKQAILLIFLACSVAQISGATDKIICYYQSWAYYREGNGNVVPEDLDPNLCTHIYYAFLGLEDDGSLKFLDSYLDVDEQGVKRISDLKDLNPDLKRVFSVGGWSAGTEMFVNVANDPDKRYRMAQSAVEFIQKYNYDGLDIDWEYPEDSDSFIDLLQDLRNELEPNGFILTAAVSSTPDHGYDASAMSEVLDIINVMTYDFHSSSDEYTGQNSPLYASSVDSDWERDNLNCDSAIKKWINQGAEPSKLALGMGFYGISYKLSNPEDHEVGSPADGAAPAGPYTEEDGSWGYNEICEYHSDGTEVWDEEQQVPYLYQDGLWVGYDNVKSVGLKAKYAVDNNLAGVIIWSIDTDDVHAICGNKNALLEEINKHIKP